MCQIASAFRPRYQKLTASTAKNTAPGVGCMISAGRYALGLDPVAHRAPSGSGDASPHELPRREDDGSNHGEPDERAHRRERMRDCEHAIVEVAPGAGKLHRPRSEEHTSELQSQSNLVCRLLLEKKKQIVREKRTTIKQHKE